MCESYASKILRLGFFGYEAFIYSVLLAWLTEQKGLDIDFNALTSAVARVKQAKEKAAAAPKTSDDWKEKYLKAEAELVAAKKANFTEFVSLINLMQAPEPATPFSKKDKTNTGGGGGGDDKKGKKGDKGAGKHAGKDASSPHKGSKKAGGGGKGGGSRRGKGYGGKSKSKGAWWGW